MIGMHGNRFLLSPDGTKLRDCCCGRDWVVYVGCLTDSPSSTEMAVSGDGFYLVRRAENGSPSSRGICAIVGYCQTAVFLPGVSCYIEEGVSPSFHTYHFATSPFGYYPSSGAARMVISRYRAALSAAAVCGCVCGPESAASFSWSGDFYSTTVVTPVERQYIQVGNIVLPSSLCYSRKAVVTFTGFSGLTLRPFFPPYQWGWDEKVGDDAFFWLPTDRGSFTIWGDTGKLADPSYIAATVNVTILAAPSPDCGPAVQAAIAAVPRNGEELGAVGMLEELEAEL